jgi:hypothetical protein
MMVPMTATMNKITGTARNNGDTNPISPQTPPKMNQKTHHARVEVRYFGLPSYLQLGQTI